MLAFAGKKPTLVMSAMHLRIERRRLRQVDPDLLRHLRELMCEECAGDALSAAVRHNEDVRNAIRRTLIRTAEVAAGTSLRPA